VDITEGIQKQATLYFCKGCERYLQPPASWVSCALESRELLAVCLKRLKGLSKVHLVDAGFVWTEPHSKRVKVKLTIQKEVVGGAILQQVFVVEYVVHHQMCHECHRRHAQDFWRAAVQVRQKTSHKKTFLYLEQLILKHRMHVSALKVKETSDGLDFFFAQKQEARKLVDFLQTVVPCRYKTSQELVSHDIHSNTFQYKHTFSVELVPVCKNEVVCLPLPLARSLGHMAQVVICTRVTTSLHLTDPQTLQVAELSSSVYWRTPFSSLCNHRQLTEFYVLHIEKATPPGSHGNSSANHSDKCVLSDVWVVPVSELGTSDRQIHCRSHLGHLLHDGDCVWGFDLSQANLNDANLDKMNPADIPDVVLVKKSYGDKVKRSKQRNWQLQMIDREMDVTVATANEKGAEEDYEEFLEDLEEDMIYRKNVNIFFNPGLQTVAVEDGDVSEDVPRVGLEEMLQEMTINDRRD
jgi:nonsense-mediated mRNA decay protein 3